MDQDILRDSIKLKYLVNKIISHNDVNINTLERRLKLPIGSVEEWLSGPSLVNLLSQDQIIKVITRLGVSFQISLKVGELMDPDNIRRINNVRNKERKEELIRETNDFIGLNQEDVSSN